MGEGQNPICSKLGITKKQTHRKVTRYTCTKTTRPNGSPTYTLYSLYLTQEKWEEKRERREKKVHISSHCKHVPEQECEIPKVSLH